MQEVAVEKVAKDPVVSRKTEFVERKGIGHPDSISDGLAEAISRKLSQEYRDRFGKILHHNTDEVQLVAGSSEPKLGGGKITEPIYILLTGRATREFQGEKVPVQRLAVEAAKEYVEENFKALEPEHIDFEARIGETSTDLKAVFSEEKPKSNDTSFGVGHAPLSPAEKVVRSLEQKLHGEIPEVGEDIKVMGLRKGDSLELTVAAAVISSQVTDIESYMEVVENVERLSKRYAGDITGMEISVEVNAADIPEEDAVYLTVTGTSAEMGDDGSVGRGNRVNGLITPHRAMSMEAASGKNPRTHVGKLYNVLANRIAEDIHQELGADYAEAKLLSRIGDPVDEPQAVEVQTTLDDMEVINDAVAKNFEKVGEITEGFVKGEIDTF